MGDFLDAILSLRATPWRKSIGMFESAARRIKSAGRPLSSVRSSSYPNPDPTLLAHSDRLLSALIDNLPGFVWMKDLDGRYVYVNEHVKRLAPYQNGWLGKTDAEIWPSELAATFRENDLKVAAGRETLETVEPCHMVGQDLWILVNKFPIFDDTGTVVMVGGAGVDITERKRAEKALQETEEKYRSIFENAVEGIFQTTPDGRFVAANPALARMLGFDSPEELISTRTDIAQEHYVEPRSRDEFKRSMEENGLVLDFEFEAYRKDGSKIWISENVRAVRDHSGTVVYYEGTTQDITGRKRAEEQLRLSERQLAEAQRIAHIGSWSWDLNSETQIWSDELYRIYGLQPGKVVPTYEAFLELVHPDDRPLLAESVERAVRTWEPIDLYLRIIRPEGEERIIHSRGRIIYDDQGNPIRKLGTAQDVTEYRRAEEALRAAEQKYRDIFENAVEGIFQTTPDGRFISANPALVKMFGFGSPEELIRERADISNQHYVDPKCRDEFKRRMEEQGVVKGFELQAYRKDGSTIWLSENVHAVRDSEGTLLYYEGTTQDITERKRVEREQRESQLQYETLVQSIDGIVWEADPQTFTFTFVSKQAERILGYPLEQWFEGPDFWPDHMHPDDRYWAVAFCVDFTERRVDHQFEYRMIAADGHVVWLSDIVTVHVEDDQSVLLRGVMVDITERKLAEEKLRQSESQLAEAQRLAHVGSWDWDLRSNTVTWSDELYRIFGLQPGEIDVAHEAMSFIHPEDRDLVLSTVESSVKNKEPYSFYYRVLRRNGDERIVHSHGYIVSDEHGKPIRVFGATQDVTEHKQAEDALREAEQKYRDIFENAGEGIFQSTPDGRVISANPALARLFGFASPEDLIQNRQDVSRQLYVDPTRREEFRRQLEEHDSLRGFEHQVFCKDGSKIWVSANAHTVRDAQGGVQYYEGTVQDITDRKQAEDELMKQKEILQKIVDHIPVMINFTDSEGRIKLVNREWQQTLGWSQEEILNEDIDIFAECYPDPQYRQDTWNFFQAATGDWIDFKTHIRAGSIIDTSWARVKLSDGTTIGIGQDITARKRAEQALRQAEQKYRELFENAKDAIYVHDLNGRFTSLNRAAEKLTGYSREEILGKSFSSFVSPEYVEHVRENLCRKLRQEGETTYEVEITTKDGLRVPVEVSSRLIYEEGVPVAVQGTARNIAERKRAEEALRGYSRQLIRAQEAERESIARELHDQIGQVLTAIRINLETIRDSSNRAESNALIDEGVTIVDEAIQQVRELSFELRPSLLDDLGLPAALRWYADRFAQRTGIHIQTSISPESRIRLPREIETASFRIVQEALTNVARHAQARNVSIDVRTLNGALSLSIKDDGIGFNSHSLINGVSLSSLGLRGMEERAHGLGGKLEIKSALHQGTEVRVHFPNGSKRK